MFGFAYVVVVVVLGLGLSVTVIGLPLLAAGLLGARQLGQGGAGQGAGPAGGAGRGVHAHPGGSERRHGGFLPWLWTSLRDPVAWRNVLYEFVRLPWGILTFTVTVVSLFLAWPVLGFVVRGLSNVDRMMVRSLLSPSDSLERRIAELESDRGVVVDTAAADLRRIERDLHDGAQARLVALAMGLGLAKEKLLEDPDAAAVMVDEAHGEVKLALRELRDLARGIHPAVLTDRGLDAALSSVASRCTVAVTVDRRPAERAPPRPSRASPISRSPNCSRTSASTPGARRLGRGVASGGPAVHPGRGRRAGGARLDGGTAWPGSPNASARWTGCSSSSHRWAARPS